jgi:hypothetical protein
VDIILPPGHSYRLVARVTEDRPTAIAAPITADGITVQGGLEFRDQTGCNGLRAANASADPTETALAIRFGPVPTNTDLDPVGASLRLSRDANGEPVLSWADVGAPGYQILRCSATAGACAPRTHADSAGPVYADPDVTPLPGESYWYVVKAVNGCTAGL